MNQIDVRKGLIDNAEQGISEAEKRFYQSYDDRIVQVKSGLTTPVPEEKEVPKDFPELNPQSGVACKGFRKHFTQRRIHSSS